ncbi:transporter substrate-binding domain-containing protein [Pseudoalteromonas caenipelagi]|uniref:transporter substrate-binding domain-containing protein n=1 Tax=Pseudoalteromonas caenipelagi TaxID=2726988 RepID=UPI003F6DE16B
MFRWCSLIFLTLCYNTLASVEILTSQEPPVNFRSRDGALTGFSVDIVKEMQKRVDDKSDIYMYPWKRAYNMALKKPNVILFTMS